MNTSYNKTGHLQYRSRFLQPLPASASTCVHLLVSPDGVEKVPAEHRTQLPLLEAPASHAAAQLRAAQESLGPPRARVT